MSELIVSALVVVLLLGVKWGGYALALRWGVPRLYPDRPPRALLVAALRTGAGVAATAALVGLGVGVANGLSGIDSEAGTGAGLAVAFGGQLVVRVLLAGTGLVAFYDRRLDRPARAAAFVAAAVLCGYLLDVPEYLLGAADLAWLLRDLRFC